MQEPSLHLPRGVLVGSTLALFMIGPLLAAIALDSGAGWRGAFLHRQSSNRGGRPFPKSSCDFFDGKIRVEVFVTPSLATREHSSETSVSTPRTPASGNHASGYLQVRLKNQSNIPLELQLLEVTAAGVDLSAEMQRVKLAAGQTLQTGSVITSREPGSSRGVPVKITMRLGEQSETREVALPNTTVARLAR